MVDKEYKNTPGPWTRKYGNYVYQGEYASNAGRLIAICEPSTKTQEDWDQVFGNADLISAAPELLEILERMMGKCKLHFIEDVFYDELITANKVIDKAKGK